jgi:hypothetical protein
MWPILRYYYSICVQVLRKTMTNFSLAIRSPALWSFQNLPAIQIENSMLPLNIICNLKPWLEWRNSELRPPTGHKGAWVERRYSSYSFSTSTLDVVSGQRQAPAVLYPRRKNRPGAQWIGGWVGPRAGLETSYRKNPHCLRRGSNLDDMSTEIHGGMILTGESK